jgi:hypothetical protein
MDKKRYLLVAGIVAAAVALSILFYTMLANHQPAIASLEADSEIVLPRGNCRIVCNATDPDGDELSYNWSANEGEITGQGATVIWAAPYFQGSYNITLTVADDRGGEAMDYVIITVRANSAPTINSLIAGADWALPLDSVRVTCDASDHDRDELSYQWAATGGDISGTGAVVDWTAPQEIGAYNITVVVRDGCGGGDARSVILTVSPGTPPTIEDLTVTAREPKYLKTTRTGYTVWKAKEYDIECLVSNASGGVSYEWSCTGGNISGEGSMITWIAPNQSSVDTTVTVIVSDVTGNQVAKSIDFHVPSCACGF